MLQTDKPEPLHIDELTGSPGINSVSKVAMGGKPVTQQQEDEDMDHKPGEAPDPEKEMEHHMKDCTPEELQEAYAKIFEGLAMIART